MQDELFEWDDEKALRNLKIRGLSFEEARTVFEDPYSITRRDELNSEFEERFVTIGLSLISPSLVCGSHGTSRKNPHYQRERSNAVGAGCL